MKKIIKIFFKLNFIFLVFCFSCSYNENSNIKEKKSNSHDDSEDSDSQSIIINNNSQINYSGIPEDVNIQIFPLDNPWNTDISKYPVHDNSVNFINSIGVNTGLHPDFGTFWENSPIGIPYIVVNSNQPMVYVDFVAWPGESDPSPYPIPDNAPIEGGNESDGDRHVLVVDKDNNKLYEMGYAFKNQNSAGWSANCGAIWDLNSNKLRTKYWTSADAAGLPIFAGLVRYDEVVIKREIKHALRFTVNNTQKGFILPATHFASNSTDPNLPPMGLRLRLKGSFDISGFSVNNQVILTALKKYGMIVADNGSNWFISGTHDPRWNDEELSELRNVKGSDFEVVYTGEIEY